MDARTPTDSPTMMDTRTGLAKLATYPFHILTWVEADGYPVSVAVEAAIDPAAGKAGFFPPAGLAVPTDAAISLTGSHIRPLPGIGYDERRHVTVWGRLAPDPATERPAPAGALTMVAERAWGWDEAEMHFVEYSERGVGQSRRYFQQLSERAGRTVGPRLSRGWLALRATRLPFLSATLVPVLLGILIAASKGFFDLPSAIATLIGASAVHLGLNVANDVFDTQSGADEANVNPTQFSGGSRVIQYGLVSLQGMKRISLGFYLLAAAVGLYLLATRFSVPLLVIGAVGMVVSFGYTAPPLKFVYRGLGEIAVAVGFGPMMLLGAYVVQTLGTTSAEAVIASLPVAILIALVLYVNEVPDRRGDAAAGKRTLPVRWPRELVVNGYLVAALAAFGIVLGGVIAGVLPIPALAALVALPLVRRVYGGLQQYYDQPYGLMAFLGVNVKLHLYVGGLLLLAYVVVLLGAALAPSVPLFLR
ncbi:MAG: prenyltransferase [Chloroflexi bacterium]|nr:prenyltransferase [Chloroflexota bacterium]